MLSHDYFESVSFDQGKSFAVSRRFNDRFHGKLHWHPFVEILLCTAPKVDVMVNFSHYSLQYNDILIAYPGDLHSVQPECLDSLLIIQFSNELLTVLPPLSYHVKLLSLYPHLGYIPFDPESEERVRLIKQFYVAFQSEGTFREVEMYALLLRFFGNVGEFCLRMEKEAPAVTGSSKHKAKKMVEACLYISQNCTQPLTLETVADFMGVSKSHFAHLFKQYTNATFVDFLTEERVKRAQSLFLNQELQIIDIAYDSGFSSVSSFNRAFKKITGMTPTQFRESMRIQPTV